MEYFTLSLHARTSLYNKRYEDTMPAVAAGGGGHGRKWSIVTGSTVATQFYWAVVCQSIIDSNVIASWLQTPADQV